MKYDDYFLLVESFSYILLVRGGLGNETSFGVPGVRGHLPPCGTMNFICLKKILYSKSRLLIMRLIESARQCDQNTLVTIFSGLNFIA